MIAGDTPADRTCPFCAASGGSHFGLRGGLVAASLFGLSACGDGEEAARLEAVAEIEAAAEAVAEAAEAEAAEAERAALEAQAAASAAREEAEEAAAEAAAEARLAAEAAAAEAETAAAPTPMRRTPAMSMYTEMRSGDDDPLTYGLGGL